MRRTRAATWLEVARRSGKPPAVAAIGAFSLQRLLAVLAMSIATAAMAQDYPSQPIRMVAPFAPGGGSDVVARAVALKLGVALGKAVVVDNRPGASGIIGADIVSKSPPDGHTVLMTNSALTSNPWLYKKLPYDTGKDLVPVSELATSALVLVAHPSAPFNSVAQLVAYARTKPKAGAVATAGAGQMGHLVAEMLSQVSGTELLMVHYKGTGASMADLLGGNVLTALVSVPGVINQISAGKLKAIAVTSPQRLATLPDVPALDETFAGFEMTTWFGTFVPAGTPKEVVEKLSRATAQVLADPEVRTELAAEGMQAGTLTSAEFDKLFRADLVRWRKFIQDRGIQIDN